MSSISSANNGINIAVCSYSSIIRTVVVIVLSTIHRKVQRRRLIAGVSGINKSTTLFRGIVAVVGGGSRIQRIVGCRPEKTILHGGQSRSWPAEQGKEKKEKVSHPSPTRCLFGENKNKNQVTHLYAWALRKPRSVSSPCRVLSTLRLRYASGCRFAKFLASVCEINFFPVSLSLSFPGDI